MTDGEFGDKRRWEYTTKNGSRSVRKGIMLALFTWPENEPFLPAKWTSLGGTTWYFNGGAPDA